MKRVTTLAVLVGLVFELSFCLPVRASAAGINLLIVGLQTASVSSASSEFVRIANPSTSPIDVTGWRIQYRSATGTTWTTKATLQGTIAAGGSLLFATTLYQTNEAHQTLIDGLAGAGGHVQLIDRNNQFADLLGWGSAVAANGSPASAPEPGQQLARKKDTAGQFINSANNAADFDLSGSVTAGQVASFAASLQPLQITELLPNPSAPQTDAVGEFIELYNPGSQPVDLKGYKLKTGTTLSNSHTFVAGDNVPAAAYKTFYITQTKTTLSNAGGKAQLVDASGAAVDETDAYGKADDGAAWALISGTWQWTTTPTPGAANILTASQPAVKAAKTSVKSSTTKSASAKTKTAAAAKQVSETDKQASENLAKPAAVHPLVLAVVGGGALAYAAYEYRQDIFNRIHQLRQYFKTRRAARSKA